MKNSLCKKYCPYYKPARDESLACLGFLVIERLISQGVTIISEKTGRTIDFADSERLFKNMCVRCSFYENDCDFAMVSRSHRESDSVSSALPTGGEKQFSGKDNIPFPCGGFTLLGYLLGENIINIDDIKKLI
jgi:hypothetical protein